MDPKVPSDILSSVTYGIAAVDRELRYVYVNDAALAMVGLPREQVLGRTPSDIFPPELSATVTGRVREALDTGEPLAYEVYHEAVDRWYENRLYPWTGGVTAFFSDITDRKRVEQDLRRREASQRELAAALTEHREVLSLAMRAGRMGAWSHDLLTHAIWWSRELEEIFGLPPGGFGGTLQQFATLVHPEDHAAIERARDSALQSHSNYRVEFRFRHASGEWRWLEARAAATYTDAGTPLSLHGVGIDITARKTADRALSEARAAAALDAAHLGIALSAARLGDWRWDAASDLVTMSPRAAELFGIPPGPFMTWAAMRNLLHPDDREYARVAVEQAVACRSDYAIEYRVINGGRERWIQSSGRATYDVDGSVIAMLGVVQDISHDRMLVRLDDAVRSLSRAEDIAFTTASFLGNHLAVNRCAYSVLEDDQDESLIVGNYTHGSASMVGRYRFADFGAECHRLMLAGEPYVVEDARSDPRIGAADLPSYEATGIRAAICVPILKQQRFVAAMAVHTTAPRQWQPDEVAVVQQVASRCWESLERARIERERAGLLQAAQSANRAKDEFLAMLGHELRNPLSPIITALELMRLRGDGRAAREREVIERQVEHLTRLVDDLLDVSRIARGKVALKMERADLADIIAQAIETASPLLEERAHRLEMAVATGPHLVQADRARLMQVFSNLLTNAAKYTPPGGRIRVALRADGDDLVVAVRDSGIGIAPELLPYVYDAFVQGSQDLDRASGGLGLGLTIVRSLVERHGGSVGAHSDGPGTGSEFVVRLPRAESTAPAGTSAPVASPASHGRGLRVLVVDDNVDAAEMLAEVLELQGFAVQTAHDGVAALARAASFRPEVALLDIGLPVMDGYELAARLRKTPGGGEMQLIAVTGYGQTADRERSAAAGFIEHLIKPVDVRRLADLIQAASLPRSDVS